MDRLDRSGMLDELAETVKSARRITAEVEKGQGWLHALVYDEPEALRRLNALLISTQALLARAESRQSAIGVLLSPESGKAAQSLLAAMEALGRGAGKPGAGEGLLTTLLFDPEYKPVAQDLQVVARNFRDVSEKLAHGEGLLGSLLASDGDGGLGPAAADFKVAMANLRAVSERLNSPDGSIGALIEDPTVYENLVQFLEGARRSYLLRALIRSSIGSGRGAGAATP
jgi:phospholipid/cholesterol/gamma-HCH transport system substrate-binding protein